MGEPIPYYDRKLQFRAILEITSEHARIAVFDSNGCPQILKFDDLTYGVLTDYLRTYKMED